MKKTILAITMLLTAGVCVMAQYEETRKNQEVQYYFFTNNIPSDWNYPLVGFVNNVNGNHSSLQVGFVNSTAGNFGGVQTGFVNSVGGNVVGIQGGFINSVGGVFNGIQGGFINSVGGGVYGMECGFINSAGEMNGLQLGFINSAESLSGLQLGFINSVNNLEKGLPIGFLSFVKHGGYKAIEVSYNNIYPLNIAFKTGVRELYTYPMLAYNWQLADDRLAFGYGIGSNLDLNNNLFINPEIEWLHQVSLDFNHYSTFRCNLGYNIKDNVEIIAGPSLVWQFKIDADDFHKNYTQWDPSIVSVNKLSLGWSVALRYKF
jgi:hypothetical protein